MNIWINEQVVIVIHLHTLCRACNVFCLQSVVLLSTGFLTQCLKQGRGEWEHRCSWVALLQRKNDLCLKMPPLSVFSASCYAPVPSFFFLQWLPCWHKDLPFAQMASSRGPPPQHTHTSYVSEVLPPWVCLRCSFGLYAQLKRKIGAERWASVLPETPKSNRYENIWPSLSLLSVVRMTQDQNFKLPDTILDTSVNPLKTEWRRQPPGVAYLT